MEKERKSIHKKKRTNQEIRQTNNKIMKRKRKKGKNI